jgi:hypothetical protein
MELATASPALAHHGGEGSRGGHVIGHTRKGKPVYAGGGQSLGHLGYAEHFTPEEHADASEHHEREALRHVSNIVGAGREERSKRAAHHAFYAAVHKVLSRGDRQMSVPEMDMVKAATPVHVLEGDCPPCFIMMKATQISLFGGSEPKAPGSRGGKGFRNERGKWRYGERTPVRGERHPGTPADKHTAECRECRWRHEGDNLSEVSKKAVEHQRSAHPGPTGSSPARNTVNVRAALDESRRTSEHARRANPMMPDTSTWDHAEHERAAQAHERLGRAQRGEGGDPDMAAQHEDAVSQHRKLGERKKLPQAHASYFDMPEGTVHLPVHQLMPAPGNREHSDLESSADRAEGYMREAAAGKRAKREPVSVRRNPAGGYHIVDGIATHHVAKRHGWTTLPAKVEG